MILLQEHILLHMRERWNAQCRKKIVSFDYFRNCFMQSTIKNIFIVSIVFMVFFFQEDADIQFKYQQMEHWQLPSNTKVINITMRLKLHSSRLIEPV